MNIELKEKIRAEARLFAFFLVLLLVPVLVFVGQARTRTSRAYAEGAQATISIRPISAHAKPGGIWDIALPYSTDVRVPFVIEVTAGDTPIDEVAIALTYDPAVYSFGSGALRCENPDGTSTAVPSLYRPLVSQTLDNGGTELGILSFTCKRAPSSGPASIAPLTTENIATLYPTIKAPARHSVLSLMKTDADVLGKSGVRHQDTPVPFRTVDAITTITGSGQQTTLSLSADTSHVETGSTFPVAVLADIPDQVRSIDVVISFDPRLLAVRSITPGPTFPEYTGTSIDELRQQEETPGTLRFSAASVPTATGGIVGHNITVGTIVFEPIAPSAQTSISLVNSSNGSHTDSSVVSFLTDTDILESVNNLKFAIQED